MGIQLFSKTKSLLWPNVSLLVQKCQAIHQMYMKDVKEEDIIKQFDINYEEPKKVFTF